MAKKIKQPRSIEIKGNNNIVGNDNVNMNLDIGSSMAELTQAFELVYRAVRQVEDPVIREDAKKIVQDIESEVKKGEEADPSRVERWLKFLAETAPDVWEVAVDTLNNPIKGIGTVLKKVIAKAKSMN